jgi:hypothetical protein
MWGHHCEGVEASLLGFNRDLVTVMDVGTTLHDAPFNFLV